MSNANATKLDWAYDQARAWWEKNIGHPDYSKIIGLAQLLRRASRRKATLDSRRRRRSRTLVEGMKFAVNHPERAEQIVSGEKRRRCPARG